MGHQALGHLLLDQHRRVERRHRLLVNHRNFSAAQPAQVFFRAVAQLFAFEEDVTARDTAIRPKEIHQRKSDRTLPAAGFTHQTQVFTLENLKRNSAHGIHFAATGFIGDCQVLDR